jgi:hypothetical protein
MKNDGKHFLLSMICISLSLHALFVWLFSKNKNEEVVLTTPFKMDWHDPVVAGRKSRKVQKESLQSALRTDWSSVASSFAEQQASTEGIATELSDVDIAANGIQVNIEKTLRDDLELPLLWKQIRLALRYRPEHSLARISGDVQVRIRVDRFGKLLRIFEEGATGPDHLVGWTILCLLEAFREPFLKKPMLRARTLDLRVQYTMGQTVLASKKNSARMRFVVEGDVYSASDYEERVPVPKGHLQPPDHPNRIADEVIFYRASTTSIANNFRDRTLKNHHEWSYYAQREYYREQCHRHLNQQACKKLQEVTKKVNP